ncbi:hypothetical protein RhiLY_00051 [Ceratobasidium sp. AG-Ba]|nr:hypothetical protein RhiLY_00051 [Ceratobasidium sp. AG-Ba]
MGKHSNKTNQGGYEPSDTSSRSTRKTPTWGKVSAAAMAKAKKRAATSKSDGETGVGSGEDSNGSGEDNTQAVRASEKGKGRKDDSSDQGGDDKEGGDKESNEDDDLGVGDGSVAGDDESSETRSTSAKTPPRARQYNDLAAPARRGAELRAPLKLKPPPRVPSEEANDNPVERAMVTEAERDDGENRGGRAAKGEDIAPKELKNAKKRVSRGALCSIAGWKSCQDADVTQRDEAGEPIYEQVIPPTAKVITPAWEEGFAKNWSSWGAAYNLDFWSKASQDAYGTHLARMSDDDIKNHLFKNTCDYSKNLRSLGRHRQTNLIVLRENARKQVGLEDEKYDFLIAPGAQSPELSDGESGATKGVIYRTRIEPAFMSEEVAKLKGVLDRAAKFQSDNDVRISYVKQGYSAKANGVITYHRR